MPEWLSNVMVQYPIVAILGRVAWYSYRKIERTNAEDRNHDRATHAAALDLIKTNYERMLAIRAEEIARLSKELREDIRKLAKAVAELSERLGS